MVIALAVFIALSAIGLRKLIKEKDKQQAALYALISLAALALGALLTLAPEYKSFARIVLDIFSGGAK